MKRGTLVHKEELMRKYEAIFIFKPEEEQVSQGKSSVQTEFQNAGIEILELEDMGNKELAYDIQDNQRGHYFCYHVQSDPDKLKLVDKNLKLRSEILKFVFFREDLI